MTALVLLAAALRVWALFNISGTVYFDYLLSDERLYHDWAVGLVNGSAEANRMYDFAPLPVYILAAIYKIFGPEPIFHRIMNVVLGALLVVPIYELARRTSGRRAAILAGFLAAVYQPFIFYSVVPLKTSLELFLFALTLWAFASLAASPAKWPKAALLGILVGLCLNTRANIGILIPFLIGVALWFRHKSGVLKKDLAFLLLAYILGLTAAVGPFVLHNYRAGGEIALTTSQTGRNLYFSNNPGNDTPYYRPVPFAHSEPRVQATQFVIEASRRVGRRMSPKEASAYWTRATIDQAMQRPGMFVKKMVQKALAVFNRYEPGDHYHIGFMSNFMNIFKIPWPPFGLVMPLGLAGFFILGFKNRLSTSLGLMAILYASTLVVFATNTRYRLPLMIMLIPVAAAGLVALKEKGRSGAIGYAAVFLAALGLAFWPLRGAGDLTAYYNGHALANLERNRPAEAARYWQMSSEANGAYSAFADLSLAGLSLDHGDGAAALARLERVPDDSFAAAVKYRVIGDIMRRMDAPEEAIRAYARSLDLKLGSSGRATRVGSAVSGPGSGKSPGSASPASIYFIILSIVYIDNPELGSGIHFLHFSFKNVKSERLTLIGFFRHIILELLIF